MKKTKFLTRVVAVVFALAILFAMSVPAWADGASLTLHDGTNTTNETVRILKEITVYNPDTFTVNEPTASYTYGISAGTNTHKVNDGTSEVTVKSGIVTNVTMTSQTNSTPADTTTLTYSPTNTNGANSTAEQFNATSDGSANTKWIDINFSNVIFGAPGVYRYEISESNYTYTKTGIVEGNTGHKRFLDVYVKANETSFTNGTTAAEWDVYGYVLSTDDTDLTTTNETTYKTTGFVADSNNGKTADQYYTFNLIVGKTVANDNYTINNHHEFPFTVVLDNPTVSVNVLPIMTVGNHATQSTLTAGPIGSASNATTWTPTIGHEGTVTYVGIPTGTTVTIKEQNDLTGVAYSAVSSGADADATVKVIDYQVDSNTATVNKGATASQAATGNSTVTFTNTLQNISPTGLAFRIAPYVLMLAAGVSLIVLFAKRKHEATDMI